MKTFAKNKTWFFLIYIFIILCFFTAGFQPLWSQNQESDFKKYFEMSFEELMNIEIQTTGKYQERIAKIPVNGSYIIREDKSE